MLTAYHSTKTLIIKLTSWAALESNSLLSWNFGSKKIFGPKKIWVQKILGPKKFWVKKILGQKSFGTKIIFDGKKLVEKNFWVQKNFGSKKILSPKKLWVQKNLSLQNILSKKFVVPPSYGIGLSMVGWISRGGLGWGFHSLALE